MTLNVSSLAIEDVKIITPERYNDDRGFFSETYSQDAFGEAGIDARFIQDNHSLSRVKGTVRGLHYQAPPFAQAKLVRVVSGAIIDVAVDARKASPTYGQWVSTEISAENGKQIFVPRGFLHGFATLTANTEVLYKVDNRYSENHSGAVFWADPSLNIDWGIDTTTTKLSDQDTTAPAFSDFASPF